MSYDLNEMLNEHPSLTTLRATYSRVVGESLIRNLALNTNLTSLSMNSMFDFGDISVLPFAEGLKSNSTLKTLELEGVIVNEHDMQSLRDGLQNNSGITKLSLILTGMVCGAPSDAVIRLLGEGLIVNTTLSSLTLKGAEMTSEIKKVLELNSSITSLSFPGMSINQIAFYYYICR